MKLYVLRVPYFDDGGPEGEDRDEWFTSLSAARKARTRHLRELREAFRSEKESALEMYGESHGEWTGAGFEIDRVLVAKMGLRELLVSVLNRTGWIARTEQVDPPRSWNLR